MKRKLINYLPYQIRKFKEYQGITTGEQPEFELAWDRYDDVFDNQFIDTAGNYGVSRWEKMLKITPKDADTLEVRKARIKAMWNRDPPYTVPWLRRWLTSLCGPAGHEETIRDYIIDLRLDYTILPDPNGLMEEIINLLLDICPCNMLIVPTAVLRPAKAAALAGGAHIGTRREIRTAVAVPALEPPGGTARAKAYGALRGTSGRLTIAVEGAQRARPPAGAAAPRCGAVPLNVYQRVGVVVQTPAGIFSKGG